LHINAQRVQYCAIAQQSCDSLLGRPVEAQSDHSLSIARLFCPSRRASLARIHASRCSPRRRWSAAEGCCQHIHRRVN
jgi:hypothetical protein